MATIQELETSLQMRWSRELLAVYGDVLQASGDVRGELIAIDLHLDDHDPTPEVIERRYELLFMWVGGSELWDDHRWYPSTWRYGFVENLTIEWGAPSQLRRQRGLDRFRSVTLQQHDGLAIFAARPEPWLRALTIETDVDDTDALIAATPNLHTLVAGGRRVAEFPHPRLRCLAIETCNIHLVEGTHIETLDLRLANELGVSEHTFASMMPETLVTLDVSQTVTRHEDRSDPPLYYLLELLPLDRFHRLRLPSIDNAVHAAEVDALCARHPKLRVEIARRHSTSHLVRAPVSTGHDLPWWAVGSPLDSRQLSPERGGDIWLRWAVEILDRHADRIPREVSIAWRELFRFSDGFDWAVIDNHPYEDFPGEDKRSQDSRYASLHWDTANARRPFPRWLFREAIGFLLATSSCCSEIEQAYEYALELERDSVLLGYWR